MQKKIVVLLSGGLDSTVLCAHLASEGYEVQPLTFLYGQRHARETSAAMDVVRALGLRGHMVFRLPVLLGSALTKPDGVIPHGHFGDPAMRAIVVPNRSMVLVAHAAAHALAVGAVGVAYAAHAGDRTIYPDCRPEFLQALRAVLALAHSDPVELLTPFARLTKAQIVRRGLELNAPLTTTWSCYEGGRVHCGKCGACRERREAFAVVGELDHVVYADQTTVPS